MKKYIIASLAVLGFIVAYYLTGSLKWSLIILAATGVYIIWVIGLELGLLDSKSGKERIEKMNRKMKEDHLKKTEDNPTLR
ncbi:MAG TPA: hypothetical protein PKC54_11110 [Ferruginibacter sp.]|mgnify:CR=1 FL=1|nr:hypothetical protein [Ferruginibacter sp.]